MGADFWDKTHGRWAGILARWIDSKFLVNKHGPCPLCGGKDRFRFDDEGPGKSFCSQCGHRDGAQLLMDFCGWDFRRLVKEVDTLLGTSDIQPAPERKEVDKKEVMRKIYKGTLQLPGTLAERYLLSRCCLSHPDWYNDLRYHPELFDSQDKTRKPALVAITRDAKHKGCGLQATFLTPDARKIWRWNYGEIGNGVWLGPSTGDTGSVVVVAEGLETTLSASKRFGYPAWAALSAATLKIWEPSSHTEKVIIAGDSDENYTGQAAAYHLANRLAVKYPNLDIQIEIPHDPGDWNDLEEFIE